MEHSSTALEVGEAKIERPGLRDRLLRRGGAVIACAVLTGLGYKGFSYLDNHQLPCGAELSSSASSYSVRNHQGKIIGISSFDTDEFTLFWTDYPVEDIPPEIDARGVTFSVNPVMENGEIVAVDLGCVEVGA